MTPSEDSFIGLKARLLEFATRQLGHGASWDDIQDAERRLNVRFPLSYRKFLHEFGWGGVEDIEIYGLGPDVPRYLNLVANTESERTEAQPHLRHLLVPLMNDGRGNHYCLDTTRFSDDECPVVFWDHAHPQGVDQEPEAVAENFVAWLAAELNERGFGR